MKPRICCTTFYTQNFSEIGEIAEKSLRKYAMLYGFDVHTYTEPQTDRPPAWNKLLVIRELFIQGYEYVLWIDADAVFQSYEQNIEDEIQDDKDLYLVGHYLNGCFTPNTGVMLIRNSTWSHKLLDLLWEQDQYIHHMWWENAAFLELYGTKDFQAHSIPYIESRLDKHKILFLETMWNSIPIKAESPSPIIVHFAGFSNDIRLPRMKGILEGKREIAWKIIPKSRIILSNLKKKYFRQTSQL